MAAQIWTIGHSTRKIDIFISLLEANEIKLVVDVRKLPGSKRYPQFNKDALAASLNECGIAYEHFPKLGDAAERLVDLASEVGPAAIMCAEAVWWRCHRALIADYLKARGVEVTHIVDSSKTEPHSFTSAARLVNGELTYAADPSFASLPSVENLRAEKLNRRKRR